MIYNDDDVCDFDANYVGSSYNPSDGNMPDGLKTFLNERVDKPQSEVLTLHAPQVQASIDPTWQPTHMVVAGSYP